jgi:anthranilate phosphoribosyltransferase
LIKEAIAKLVDGEDLSHQEICSVMEQIMQGQASPAQIAGLLTALRMKGETVTEITGGALTLRKFATTIKPRKSPLVDTCGTGGDGANSFNISTTAAFIVAGVGIPVAKHGNRSVSSMCGSADVLEHLGINLDLQPDAVTECIERIGIGFLFAPRFHQALSHSVAARRELGIRSMFNLLGPLVNPANAPRQLIGVYKGELTEVIARVLRNLGLVSALVVHGAGGLDEISNLGPSRISLLRNGHIHSYYFDPQELGFPRVSKEAIQGGTPRQNAQITLEILQGKRGPKRDIAVLNSAGALLAAGVVDTIADGVHLAQRSIDTGAALGKLEELRNYGQTNSRSHTCA